MKGAFMMRNTCSRSGATRGIFALMLWGVLALVMPGIALAEGQPIEDDIFTSDQFTPAEGCACHAEFISQWEMSLHSQASFNPTFEAKLDEAEPATRAQIEDFCRSCHGPVAYMTGELGMAAEDMTGASADSIGCSFCHQVTGTDEPIANLSQRVEPDGVYRGGLDDAQAPHPAMTSEFHRTAEFCGSCHNVNHPVNGLALEATYTEWLNSPQAEQGITCQDCHMSEAPGVIGPTPGRVAEMAPEREEVHRMTFWGAHVERGNAEAAVQMLRAAATLTVEVPDVLTDGSVEGVVQVTNSGAGHYLPTGLTDVRQMWLEVLAVDEAGTETEIARQAFGTVFRDAEGQYPAQIWDAVAIQSDIRVPPMESVPVTFTASLPEGAESGTIVARLKYSSITDKLAEAAGRENPVTLMSEISQPIYASPEAKQAAERGDGLLGIDTGTLVVALGALAVVVVAAIGILVLRKRKSAGA